MSSSTLEELSVLNERKVELTKEHEQYLEKHPELKTLLSSFMCAVLMEKPNDVIEFAREHFNSTETTKQSTPPPLVISGPSGVGKGTLINKLLEKYPERFGFSVSHTTRMPRPGEEDGRAYHFVNKDEIQADITSGAFLEHAQVHGNVYGTSKKAVEQLQAQSKICILDIDVQGVAQVKESAMPCKYIFIAPPSMDKLQERLRGRGTESEEKIALRIANAKTEMEYSTRKDIFDRIIVNEDLDAAFIQLEEQIKRWYHFSKQ